MQKYIEKADRMHLPALAMRGLIAFPAIPLTFEVADEADAGVCLEAEKNDGVIFIVSLRDLSLTGTTEENLYSVGTVVKINIADGKAAGWQSLGVSRLYLPCNRGESDN